MHLPLTSEIEEANVGQANNENLSLLRLLKPEVLADPYPLYRALREYHPVHWDPYMHAWVVTGYPEVVTALTNYSSDRAPTLDYLDRHGLSFMKPFAEMMQQQMLFMDGVTHARLRAICAAAFTPHKVEELRTEIQAVADELIDKVSAYGHLDMIADFAAPLPAIITAKLMGFPVKDHRLLGVWVNDIVELHGNFQHHPDRVAEIVQSLQKMKTYASDRMNELREHPNDGLICSLMIAEVDGQRLTNEEVIASTIVTMIGGHETTTNLIASGFLTLLRNPDCLEQLRNHPEIVASAVEELLRYESPGPAHRPYCASRHGTWWKENPQGGESGGGSGCGKSRREPIPRSRLPGLTSVRQPAFGVRLGISLLLRRPVGPNTMPDCQIAFATLLRRLSRPALLHKTLHWQVTPACAA